MQWIIGIQVNEYGFEFLQAIIQKLYLLRNRAIWYECKFNGAYRTSSQLITHH